jgi:dTMP kinase
MLIMVDGIDGSGKSSVIEAWKDYLISVGNSVFDLKQYWKDTANMPLLSELKSYDFIISGEPTYTGVGKVIRHELIRKGTHYSAQTIAEAYALDRLILYQTTLLPLISEGKHIIQDRGVSTSYAYQPVSDPAITVDFLNSLEGNKLALDHRPDHLILLNATPHIAMERLQKRADKQDDVIFEQLDFATRLAERFAHIEYRTLFTSRGTTVSELPADTDLVILKEESITLLKKILSL